MSRQSLAVIMFVLAAVVASGQSAVQVPGLSFTVLEDFETDRVWTVEPSDRSIGPTDVEARFILSNRRGAPKYVGEEESRDLLVPPLGEQKQVLGLRITTGTYANHVIRIAPETPIPLPEGRPILFSFWAASENLNHRLYAVFRDAGNHPYAEVFLTALNYFGWKRTTSPLYLYVPEGGLSWDGFTLVTDPLSHAVSPQYLYFDVVSVGVRGTQPGAAR